MATRRAFLADSQHRLRFVYLPKHSSWLNQIEIVFGILLTAVAVQLMVYGLGALGIIQAATH
jgi:thiol:disulfide interchange protein